MRIHRLLSYLLFSVVVAGFTTSCDSSTTSPSDTFRCPTEADTLTWASYGNFQLKNAGYDDQRLVTNCGWHIYQDHVGGIGKTFQVASPSEGVVLIWAYGIFSKIQVAKGWTGVTTKGAKIGDSMATFLSLHPEFTRGGPVTYVYYGTFTVVAGFDDQKNLGQLTVGSY